MITAFNTLGVQSAVFGMRDFGESTALDLAQFCFNHFGHNTLVQTRRLQ